jgi:hypothetical protein
MGLHGSVLQMLQEQEQSAARPVGGEAKGQARMQPEGPRPEVALDLGPLGNFLLARCGWQPSLCRLHPWSSQLDELAGCSAGGGRASSQTLILPRRGTICIDETSPHTSWTELAPISFFSLQYCDCGALARCGADRLGHVHIVLCLAASSGVSRCLPVSTSCIGRH